MEPDDRVLELVERWELLCAQGQAVTPHDLCPDDPELRAQLERAIEQLQGTGKVFDLHEALTPMTSPPGPPPGPPTGDYRPPAGGKPGPDSAADHPRWIGKYRVVEHLGGGGQAEVFRAVHPALPGRGVVIKC